MSLDYVRPKEKQKRELSRHSADKGNLFIVVPVDLDDDAALQKLTVDMLKGYHKKYNLPSSTPTGLRTGLRIKARAQLLATCLFRRAFFFSTLLQ